jgi:hypothetical protein
MHSTSIFDGRNKQIEIGFSSQLSHFGGLPAVVQHLRTLEFDKKLFAKLNPTFDKRREQSSRYALKGADLVWQRLTALLCGREDLNDHEMLAQDPIFRAVIGDKEVAGCSTLCRFERTIEQETIDKGNEFLQEMFLRYGSVGSTIIIDVDNTPVELYGYQENHKFNGHYGCNCYLPMLAFIQGFPVGVYNGTQDGRKTLLNVLKPLVEKLREKHSERPILLRADSGFNNVELIDLCEKLDIYYIIGLSPNKALTAYLAEWEPEFIDVIASGNKDGNVLRHMGEIEDYQASSWSGPRRVIVRDYFNDSRREWDTRYIQTNIPKEPDPKKKHGLWRYNAKKLYEILYCRRGLAEQYNQEFKVQAFGARTSSHRFLTNSYRMLLAALCQCALKIVRRNFCRRRSPWKKVAAGKFRQNFICIPTIVEDLKTKMKLRLTGAVQDIQELKHLWLIKT